MRYLAVVIFVHRCDKRNVSCRRPQVFDTTEALDRINTTDNYWTFRAEVSAGRLLRAAFCAVQCLAAPAVDMYARRLCCPTCMWLVTVASVWQPYLMASIRLFRKIFRQVIPADQRRLADGDRLASVHHILSDKDGGQPTLHGDPFLLLLQPGDSLGAAKARIKVNKLSSLIETSITSVCACSGMQEGCWACIPIIGWPRFRSATLISPGGSPACFSPPFLITILTSHSQAMLGTRPEELDKWRFAVVGRNGAEWLAADSEPLYDRLFAGELPSLQYELVSCTFAG